MTSYRDMSNVCCYDSAYKRVRLIDHAVDIRVETRENCASVSHSLETHPSCQYTAPFVYMHMVSAYFALWSQCCSYVSGSLCPLSPSPSPWCAVSWTSLPLEWIHSRVDLCGKWRITRRQVVEDQLHQHLKMRFQHGSTFLCLF